MAVAVDATGTKLYQASAVAASYAGITVGAGANRALVVGIAWGLSVTVAPTSVSVVWDSVGANQAMTLIATVTNGNASKVSIYGLVAPASGHKTLSVSWTNTARDCFIAAMAYTGVDQTGGATSFPNSQTGSATNTVSVTSAVGNYVQAAEISTASLLSGVTGTTIFLDNASGGVANAAANYDVGAATVVIGTGAAQSDYIAATDIKAAAAGGGFFARHYYDMARAS